MDNIEYMENEFKLLKMDPEKKEYLKEVYKDIINIFELNNLDSVEASYRIGVVFQCINNLIDNNEDFDTLLERSSETLSKAIVDDDENQRMENKKIIEILAVIYNTTKEDNFQKFNVNLLEYLEQIYRLILFKPLSELKGSEDEWVYNEDTNMYTNKRYWPVSAKDNKGTDAKNSSSKLYTRDNGNTWYSETEEIISFPYTVPLHIERVYLENYVKDIYGPSVIIDNPFADEKQEGMPKYSEYCLGFLPSTSEGDFTKDTFKANYAIIHRMYDPERDVFTIFNLISINVPATRESAIKTFETLKTYIEGETYEGVDLKEVF